MVLECYGGKVTLIRPAVSGYVAVRYDPEGYLEPCCYAHGRPREFATTKEARAHVEKCHDFKEVIGYIDADQIKPPSGLGSKNVPVVRSWVRNYTDAWHYYGPSGIGEELAACGHPMIPGSPLHGHSPPLDGRICDVCLKAAAAHIEGVIDQCRPNPAPREIIVCTRCSRHVEMNKFIRLMRCDPTKYRCTVCLAMEDNT